MQAKERLFRLAAQITQTSPLFSRTLSRGMASMASKPQPNWQARELRKSQVLTNNSGPYRDNNLDMRWHQPTYVASFVCNDPRQIISEFVVARHRNRTEDKDKEGLISMQVRGRLGVAQQFLELFLKAGLVASLPFEFKDDAVPRLLLTTNCREEKERDRLNKMIRFVDGIVPLGETIKTQLTALMQPENNQPNLPFEFPLDKEARPIYFYNRLNNIPCNGSREVFDPKYDYHPVTAIPEIHQAIHAGNIQHVERLLDVDPTLADCKDPWGNKAIEAAHCLGYLEIFERCYQAKLSYPSNGLGDTEQLQIYSHLLRNWKERGYNAVIYFATNPITPEEYITQGRDKYLKQLQQPIPVRPKLHQQCIDGDVDAVIAVLSRHPERIEEHDHFGYTPLILSLACSHDKLTRWLLDHGASVDTVCHRVEGGERRFRPIDNASTPTGLELILYRGVDPHSYNKCFANAVKTNNVLMAKHMLYYLNKLPVESGLTAFELVLKYSCIHGCDLLKVFLNYYRDPVPDGPYDTHICEYVGNITQHDPEYIDPQGPFGHNISEEAVELIKEHNRRIAQRDQARAARPKLGFQQFQPQTGAIESSLQTPDGVIIQSSIRPVNTVSDQELEEIQKLFFSSFRMIKDNTPENQRAYIDYAFSLAKKNDDGYISICKSEDRIVSFLTFEVQEQPDFTLFHAQLASNDKAYSSMGLSNLAFLVCVTLSKRSEKDIYAFLKAIPPGFGLCLLPVFIRFFPKFALPPEFIEKIVQLTGEDLFGKTIPAKLEVIESRLPNRLNFTLDYYNHIVADTKDAMAVCYKMDEKAAQDYLEEFSHHGITEEHIDNFAVAWQEMKTFYEMQSSSIKARL